LCRQEELAAGDSGQVYVSARMSTDPDETSPLWEKIHVEFPAMNGAAYFTRRRCPEDVCELLFDELTIALPVEWEPDVTLPPYNYSWDQAPIALSSHLVRLLNEAQSIADFYARQYQISRSRVEIRLWNNLVVPLRFWYTTVANDVEMILWPDNPEQYGQNGGFRETHDLAHEWAHMIQSEVIYRRMDLPGGGGDHSGCETQESAEKRWTEGTAEGLAELYTVNALGTRFGTISGSGPGDHVGPGQEFESNNWICSFECTPELENSVAFYFYLMSRLWPHEVMNTWRNGLIVRPSSPSPDIVKSAREFHNVWNDRQRTNAFIYNHTPGPISDDAIYALALFCADPVAAFNSDPENASDPGIVTGIDAGESEEIRQLLARPNPFRAGTHLSIALGREGPLRVEVFDTSGRRVRRLRAEGTGRIVSTEWNGLTDAGVQAGSGVYFVRASRGEGVLTRRIVLIR